LAGKHYDFLTYNGETEKTTNSAQKKQAEKNVAAVQKN